MNPIRMLATRNLPEAFHTPRLVNTRDFRGDGTYEETFQFAAIPTGDGLFTVHGYKRSMMLHDGGAPVSFLVSFGHGKEDAQDVAMACLEAEKRDCLKRRDDYADHGRLTLKLRNTAPRIPGFCWRPIRPDRHAMTSPPAAAHRGNSPLHS